MNELDQQSLRLIEKFDLLQSSFSFDPETFKYINLLKLEFYALENGAFFEASAAQNGYLKNIACRNVF